MFGSLACHLRFALIVMLVILVIILLSKWSGSSSNSGGGGGGGGGGGKSRASLAPLVPTDVGKLIKTAKKWSKQSGNDGNPVAALVHATYAVAYLDAARIMSDEEVDGVEALSKTLEQRQQAAVRHIHAQCPNVV